MRKCAPTSVGVIGALSYLAVLPLNFMLHVYLDVSGPHLVVSGPHLVVSGPHLVVSGPHLVVSGPHLVVSGPHIYFA